MTDWCVCKTEFVLCYERDKYLTLSGMQKRCVAFIRALGQKPRKWDTKHHDNKHFWKDGRPARGLLRGLRVHRCRNLVTPRKWSGIIRARGSTKTGMFLNVIALAISASFGKAVHAQAEAQQIFSSAPLTSDLVWKSQAGGNLLPPAMTLCWQACCLLLV